MCSESIQIDIVEATAQERASFTHLLRLLCGGLVGVALVDFGDAIGHCAKALRGMLALACHITGVCGSGLADVEYVCPEDDSKAAPILQDLPLHGRTILSTMLQHWSDVAVDYRLLYDREMELVKYLNHAAGSHVEDM